GVALGRLAQEDPSFRVRTDEESGQTIISGMGELHLEIIVDRMKREFGVEASVGKPQVAYRETFKKSLESEGKFIKQSGGRGQYGHVWLKLEPQHGKGYEFVDGVKGGRVPKEFIPAVKKGIDEALQEGVLAGYPDSRRDVIQGMEDLPGSKAIKAEVPLNEMFGYSTQLRSLTQGRATYTMEFKHYAEAPKNIADSIIKKDDKDKK